MGSRQLARKRSAECWVLSEEKKVGSGQWARKRSAELKKVYQKTLWAGLKRILLLRFLCLREEM